MGYEVALLLVSQPASHSPSQPATHSPTLKVEYISSHWSDLTQIWNTSLRDQSKLCNCFKWRQPLTEDNLKILKVKYLIRSYPNLKLQLRWPNQNLQKIQISLTQKTTSKYWMLNISATTAWILAKFEASVKVTKQNLSKLQMITTFDGRRPQSIKTQLPQ